MCTEVGVDRWCVQLLVAFTTTLGLVGCRDVEVARGQVSASAATGNAAVIEGVVTIDGQPASRQRLSVLSTSAGAREHSLETDDLGRFSVGVERVGEFQINLRAAKRLTATHRYVTIREGRNNVRIDVPRTEIVVSVKGTSAPVNEPVQVYIEGPVAPTHSDAAGVLTPTDLNGVTLRGVEPGVFSIVASTPTGLVSQRAAVVEVAEGRSVSAELTLMRRPLQLIVSDSHGFPIAGASVTVHQNKLKGSDATFDAGRVPPEKAMVVSAPGFLPVCDFAATDGPAQRIVMEPLRDVSASFVLRKPASVEHLAPIGRLEGTPQSRCPVALRLFPITVDETPTGDLRVEVKGLPPGRYVYSADSRASRLMVTFPGDAGEYAIPERCAACSSR
jgi:hypothetical protein